MMTYMTRVSLIVPVLAIAALFAAEATAFAHAFLTRAVPSVGSTVPASPPTLTLLFTEGVVPRFSRVQVLNAQDHPVKVGALHSAAGNDRQLVLGLPPLLPGRYAVVWHATAKDTHKTEGRFTFSVVSAATR